MYNIPFGNSDFQIKHFIANEHSPERAVRKILLNLDKKQMALAEYLFNQRENNIRRREIQKKLQHKKGFEKEKLELELEKLEFHEEHSKKLLDDCLHEIETYKGLLEKLPKFTREDFEKSEIKYWTKRLIADARREIMYSSRISTGTLESLEQIGITVGKNEKGITFKRFKKILENGNQTQLTDKREDIKEAGYSHSSERADQYT